MIHFVSVNIAFIYYQVNDRIIVIRLDTKPTDTTLISVYMPTSAHEEEDVEEIYEKIEEQIAQVRDEENLIILGD